MTHFTARRGFLVDRSNEKPPSEPPTHYMDLFLTRDATFAKKARAIVNRVIEIDCMAGQLPTLAKINAEASAMRHEYNGIDNTKQTLEFLPPPSNGEDPEPTCIRWEWVDGEFVARYNYSVEVMSGDEKIFPAPLQKEQAEDDEDKAHLTVVCFCGTGQTPATKQN